MKLSRIKFILIGIALILLSPIMAFLYGGLLDDELYVMFGYNDFFLLPSPGFGATWWVALYLIWPFYIPGIVVTIIGIVLAIVISSAVIAFSFTENSVQNVSKTKITDVIPNVVFGGGEGASINNV